MSARPSNPCGDLQSLADRAVALGPEHGRTKELMGWAVCEIERLRAELATVTAARDRWHRKYEGACATIDTYSSDETRRADYAALCECGWQGHNSELTKNCPACRMVFERPALKALPPQCNCDPNPSIGGSPPCPVHDGESEDAS